MCKKLRKKMFTLLIRGRSFLPHVEFRQPMGYFTSPRLYCPLVGVCQDVKERVYIRMWKKKKICRVS